jgi:hypothetical protein
MGHIRLGRLPATRKWQQVIALFASGSPSEHVVGASSMAAESSLERARNDPALVHSFWLLTQLPLAARSSDFEASLHAIDLRVRRNVSLLEIAGAMSDAIDRRAERAGGRTDLGELAQHAAVESLTAMVSANLPSLFEPKPDEVRFELGKFAARDRFAQLARDFFARLTQRHLDYYLSRELSNHTGPGMRLGNIEEHTAFNSALELYCREASRIVERFAGGWYSKTNFRDEITPEKAGAFVFVALRKISRELRKRQNDDG